LEDSLKIFKDHLAQHLCHGWGHLPLNQVAQSPIQPHLEQFQEWGILNFSGQSVAVPHHPHHKKSLLYVQSKFTLFQFKTFSPLLVTMGLGKNISLCLSYKPPSGTERLL